MRAVLSHLNFREFAGTETYTLALAQQLDRLGHDITIYAVNLGPMADFAREQGLPVVNRPADLPRSCDAVFAQDAASAYELAGRYPEAVRIFTMHSRLPLQSPPRLSHVCHAVVVLNDRLRRRAEHIAGPVEIVRLRQPVDLMRFSARWRGQVRRPRVLTLTNHADGPRQVMLESACRQHGFELTRLGGQLQATPRPEHAMVGADIVISLGRGALEAMAMGRNAYVLGPIGGDGWVTPENYPALESDGFSGRATDVVVDLPRLAADFAGWDAGLAQANRDLAWAHHDVETHALELVELVARLSIGAPAPVPYAEELARLVRMEWQEFARADAAMVEVHRLRAEADTLREGLGLAREQSEAAERRARDLADATHRQDRERIAGLEQELADARAQLAALIGLRRYRLACHVARPLDRLREFRRPANG